MLTIYSLFSVQHVAQQNGPYQAKAADLYTRLRKNLVDTVYKSWEETGFAWEQYDPETGKGQRTQHFTGWTSLVVKIMAMPDLSNLALASSAAASSSSTAAPSSSGASSSSEAASSSSETPEPEESGASHDEL